MASFATDHFDECTERLDSTRQVLVGSSAAIPRAYALR
jgi:hypothetical protein